MGRTAVRGHRVRECRVLGGTANRVGLLLVRIAIVCGLALLALVLLEAWWPGLVDPVFAWWSA